MGRKNFPSLREEDQHMAAALKPTVIGPGAYASPDPATQAARLVPVDEHPLKLDKDYGKGVPETVSMVSDSSALGEATETVDYPEDRDEWSKENWKAKADEYGIEIPAKAKKDEVREAVESYEDENGLSDEK